MDQISMQAALFCLFFVFSIPAVAGWRAQWQVVDKMALKLIFGNISTLLPSDFANAPKEQDVDDQCEANAQFFDTIDPILDSWIREDDNPSETKKNMTMQGCKDYFAHRRWVQIWADFLFKELAHDYEDGYKDMILTPWHSAYLKSLFWYMDSQYHYIFSCTMLKFMATAAETFKADKTKMMAFLNTVKLIQEQFYGPSSTDDMEDPKNRLLFKINEQTLRGTGSYFYDLISPDFIKECTYEGEGISDFSPNSWQNVFTDTSGDDDLQKKK